MIADDLSEAEMKRLLKERDNQQALAETDTVAVAEWVLAGD